MQRRETTAAILCASRAFVSNKLSLPGLRRNRKPKPEGVPVLQRFNIAENAKARESFSGPSFPIKIHP
jgi:hypothetical protein